jgi:hypothetical protein
MKIAAVAIIALFGLGWYNSDAKINKLQKEQRIMHCQHVLYEDYSTIHQDAELARKCVETLGYKLSWK